MLFLQKIELFVFRKKNIGDSFYLPIFRGNKIRTGSISVSFVTTKKKTTRRCLRNIMLAKNQTPSLKTILLIDDDSADNIIHRRLLENMNIADNIEDFLFAEDALSFLKSEEGQDTDLIFLDINMPRMNGFEFLDEFKKLKSNPEDLPMVVMLSTSNPNWDDDVSRNYPLIKHFFTKPLTEKFVVNILDSINQL